MVRCRSRVKTLCVHAPQSGDQYSVLRQFGPSDPIAQGDLAIQMASNLCPGGTRSGQEISDLDAIGQLEGRPLERSQACGFFPVNSDPQPEISQWRFLQLGVCNCRLIQIHLDRLSTEAKGVGGPGACSWAAVLTLVTVTV